ncbi:MAG: HupE/UreJ family protein [Pontibacterium sp.]
MVSRLMAALLALSPAAVFAHESAVHYVPHGFAAGLVHPLLGLDHLAVMFAVGYWMAGKYAGVTSTRMSAIFVGALALGAVSGLAAGVAVEQVILLSVFVAAAVLLTGKAFNTKLVAAVLASIAVFHGIAHGHEMPADSVQVMYVLGFSIACAGLVALGYRTNALLIQVAPKLHAKLVAGVVALCGVLTFAG